MMLSRWNKRYIAGITKSRFLDHLPESKIKRKNISECLAVEETEINKFCAEKGFKLWQTGQEIRIVSRLDCWRIILQNNHLALYHRNRQFRIKGNHSRIGGFHFQSGSSDTIMEYLKEIDEHDKYKENDVPKAIVRKKNPEMPKMLIKKFGDFIPGLTMFNKRIKGTNRYKEAKKRRKKIERKNNICRVISLINELSD